MGRSPAVTDSSGRRFFAHVTRSVFVGPETVWTNCPRRGIFSGTNANERFPRLDFGFIFFYLIYFDFF
jgi:hypothetical protein